MHNVFFSVCNRTITMKDETTGGGRITSPGYPTGYLANMVCVQSLKAPYGWHFNLFFTDFQLESKDVNGSCSLDSLQVFLKFETLI